MLNTACYKVLGKLAALSAITSSKGLFGRGVSSQLHVVQLLKYSICVFEKGLIVSPNEQASTGSMKLVYRINKLSLSCGTVKINTRDDPGNVVSFKLVNKLLLFGDSYKTESLCLKGPTNAFAIEGKYDS